MAIHTQGPLSLFPTSFGSAVVVVGSRTQRGQTGITVGREATSGNVNPDSAFINQSDGQVPLEVYDIARLIDAVGLESLNLAAGSNSGAILYSQVKPVDALRAGSGAHTAWTIAAGRCFIARIRCEQGRDAVATLQLHAVSSNGTTIPISTSAAATLPTIPLDNHRFTIGPVSVGIDGSNVVTISQVQSVDIELGFRATPHYQDGFVHPMAVTIDEIMPMIRITTTDVAKMISAGVSFNGRPFDYSHTYVYLRKRLQDASAVFVPNDTAEHIKFVPTAGLAVWQNFTEASGSNNATATLELHCTRDANTAAITVDTTAAIE